MSETTQSILPSANWGMYVKQSPVVIVLMKVSITGATTICQTSGDLPMPDEPRPLRPMSKFGQFAPATGPRPASGTDHQRARPTPHGCCDGAGSAGSERASHTYSGAGGQTAPPRRLTGRREP